MHQEEEENDDVLYILMHPYTFTFYRNKNKVLEIAML